MAIKFNNSSELVENYKEMCFLSSENQILGMCGDDGNRLYSIGDNGKLNLFCESSGKDTGWVHTELSKPLEALVGEKLLVKGFSAKKRNDKFHVAAIVNHHDKDELFVSYTEDPANPEWKKIAFDDETVAAKGIDKVYTCGNNDLMETVADVVNASGYLERYFVDCNNELGGDKKWHKHPLQANYEKTINSCMGKKKLEDVPGIYTFGTLGDEQQLIYTPIYNVIDPSRDPMVTKIDLPERFNIMTTYERPDGYTDLFMCGSGKLYMCPYDNQKNKATPVCIAESEHFDHVKELYAYLSSTYNIVMIWGRNETGRVFYCHCNPDSLTDRTKWSKVYVQMEDAIYFNAYYSERTGCGSSIACTQNREVKISTQSPGSSVWRQCSIGLPASNETMKFDSYTTKITVTDDCGKPLANKEVWIESKDYYNVYINNVYHSLDKTPLLVKTDASGALRFVSQTDTLYSYEFYIYEKEGANDNEKTEIVAWHKPVNKIFGLQNPKDIKAAQIVRGDGTSKPLVDQSLSDNDLKAIGEAMKYMSNAKEELVNPTLARQIRGNDFRGLFVSVGPEGLKSFSGEDAIRKGIENKMLRGATILPDGTISVDRLSSARTGDTDGLLDFLWDALNDILYVAKETWSFFINFAHDVWEFTVQIAGKIYKFLLNCADAIITGLQIVWKAIKVAVEELVDYIKFVFNIEDIQKTANVINHLFNVQIDCVKSAVDNMKGEVHGVAKKLKQAIDDWGKVTYIEGLDSRSINKINDQKNQYADLIVSCTFLTDHLVENISRATLGKNMLPEGASSGEITEINDYETAFIEFIRKEKEIYMDLCDRLKIVFKEDPTNMDFLTLSKKILALITDAVIDSVENGADLILDLAKDYLEAVRSLLCTELHVPVLSDILKEWFGIKPFSVLEVLAFVFALDSNVIYKVITGEALLTDAQYKRIMAIGNKNAVQGIIPDIVPDEDKNRVYLLTHVISATVSLGETALYPFFACSEEFGMVGACIDGALAFIAAGLNVMGDIAYQPYSQDIATQCIPYAVKYIPLAVKLGAAYKENNEMEEAASAFYAVGNAIDNCCNCIDIIETCTEKSGAEKSLGVVSLLGYAIGDYVTILDQFIKFDMDPDTKLYLIVAREVCEGASLALDMASGFVAHNNNLPKLDK